ncbi:MAG: type II secretion system secretin GspD [Gammaproteobacteria bacterium]
MLIISGLLLSTVLKADTVSINFREADIRSVIEAVAEITGKSFVLDPRVRGEITIISPEPIESELLYEAVLSALQVQGFQAVDDGAVIRVVPFAQSFQIPSGVMGSELQTKVLRVNHVQANELLPVLKPMMSRGSLLQAYDAGNNLVATDTVSQIAQLERVLSEIDVPEQSAIDVINLRHISAAEALHIASQMQNLQQQNLSIVEDSFNNRIIVGGPRTGRAAFREMLKSLDVPTDSNGGVEVLYLNYSKAEDIKPILDGMLESETFLAIAGEGTTTEGGSRSSYRIEAEADNNALVIAASASVIEQIREVVRKLDRPRSQVLIEAVIAEVSQEQANRLSVQLAGASRYTGSILTNFDNLIPTLVGVAADGELSDNELSNINLNTGVYVSAGDIDQDSGEAFGVIIDALRTDSRTTILSSPSVVTLDNSEAELTVGQEVPFITGSFTSSNNSSNNPFQTIEREEVGVKLRVIPQINEGNAVRLEIEQESSSIAGTATSLGTADTVTNKRTISTNVMVGDGQLLILGGLMDDNFGNTDRKVPFLGDLPVLGGLFRSRTNNDDQRVLMMFIRPTILRSPAESSSTTNQRFDYLRSYDIGNGQTLGETPNTVLQQFDNNNQVEQQGTPSSGED